MKQSNQGINPQILKDAKLIYCSCGNAMFSDKIMLKKISAIVSPTGNEELLPINVLVCDKCNKIPSDLNLGNMIPKEFIASKIIK